ncbi:MAG TPA: hypothetical protein VIL29_10695, partial [Pseudothermotoga sp.]
MAVITHDQTTTVFHPGEAAFDLPSQASLPARVCKFDFTKRISLNSNSGSKVVLIRQIHLRKLFSDSLKTTSQTPNLC